MYRLRGTKRDGTSFDGVMKYRVWWKGRTIQGLNPDQWRLDACGALIYFDDYGKTDSKYGWEIDHIVPVALGGGDEIDNLQPLQWQNNRAKSDGPLVCVVT